MTAGGPSVWEMPLHGRLLKGPRICGRAYASPPLGSAESSIDRVNGNYSCIPVVYLGRVWALNCRLRKRLLLVGVR